MTEAALVLNDQGGGFVGVERADVAPTCRRETRHHEAVMLMKEETMTCEKHQADPRVAETDTAPAPDAVPFTKTAHPSDASGAQGYEQTDTAKTLNTFACTEARAEEVIAYENHQTDSRTSETEVAPCAGASQNGGLANNNPLVQYRYAVRRITPVEGERLQGFADNWTRPCFRPEDITDELVDRFIGIHQNWSAINGKPDAKPKSREQVRKWLLEISSADCPDGPRYKAIGNSMSVNVMRWIGLRIEECERQTGSD